VGRYVRRLLASLVWGSAGDPGDPNDCATIAMEVGSGSARSCQRGEMSQRKAAKVLGVSRATIHRLLAQKGYENTTPESQ
jgi:helix-turn-helix, Psq domain